MAIKIAFDSSHNVISPTLVLTTRSGDRLGGLLYHDLVVKQSIRQSMEMSFSVNKNDYCEKNHNAGLWNLITDFKLVWCKEWNCYFEINVTTNEEYTTDKEVTAISLGDAELSQINLYNVQINTEDDIARDDYEPAVLYNENNANASLLHRIMEKVPHYTIKYVDPAIVNIQRTFSFDSKSLYDAFQEIAEEIECVFDIICRDGTNGIERNIYIYDLENYGKDTNILLTTDALADNINYSIDAGAVKNCFKLEGGDDLMTATVRNCNPNGSGYIWYISDELKSDMSDDLVSKLESYNDFYNYYQNAYNPFNVSTTGLSLDDASKVIAKIPNYSAIRNKYNSLIDKYSIYSSDYQKISQPMVGYPSIMQGYYNTVDFYYYLNDNLMPTVQMSDTNAQDEAAKLHFQSLKNTAVQYLSSTTSTATVNSAIAAIAKAIVDARYQVKVLDEDCSFTYSEQNSTWSGKIKVTNYSDEEDTYTVTLKNIIISSDYEKFIRQKLETALANTRTDTIADIIDLFGLDDAHFKAELKRYSLQRLKAFHDACQGCIDVLIQQGIADNNSTESTMYKQIYLPYYNKLGFIQSEMDVRQREIEIVAGKFDSQGGLLEDGMQTVLEKERDGIQNNLNFQDYLGLTLWQEFAAYRREDTYSNTNYVSDGLGNNELFARAMEFIKTAKDEIEKSATKQHTINARLKNLLVMKEFASIVDCFEVGNWLRLKVDGKLFKLRLVDYQIDFENLESIDITFSDIVVDGTEATAKDILNQAASMATSYNTVSRQARKGDKTSSMVDNFVNEGLALTTTKIIDTADNQEVSWDKHGLVCREYDNLADSYSDTQVKLINKGVYVTDNNWRTAKAGIGNFTFFNPAANNGDGEYQEAYGVIADTLVGNLILGKSVGIYNTKNSITMDEDGFVLTTDGTGSDNPQSVFTIRRKTVNNGVKSFKDMFYIDSNGYVTINGGVKIDIDGGNTNSTMVEMVDGKITTHITEELEDGGLIESSISYTAGEIRSEISDAVEGLESQVSQTAGEIKSTVSAAVSKWDLSDLTHSIDLYGYGHPQTDNNLNPQDYPNKYYLDQTTGYVYYVTNGAWSKTQDELTLITANLSSQIDQTADEIKSVVAEATSKYDETGYNISVRGYGVPTISGLPPTDYNGLLYLDQETGKLYTSNGGNWITYKGSNNNDIILPLITSNLSSSISQTATNILSAVSSTYETKQDSNDKKTALESSINQTASNIASTVKATSGWDIASLDYAINIIGVIDRGDDHSAIGDYEAADHIGEFYLDDLTGRVYESKLESGSDSEYAWWWKTTLTRSESSIYSRIDQTAGSIMTTVGATYETKESANTKKTNLESQISQTANQVKSTIAQATSKYDETGYSISIRDYGDPNSDIYPPSGYQNKFYLNQETGAVYKSTGSGSTWEWNRVKDSENKNVTLTLITDTLSSSITQTASNILSTVSSTYETKSDSNTKKEALESSINQTDSNIASTVKSTFGWDIASLSYKIDIIGVVDRGSNLATIGDYVAAEHIGEYYLDNLTGHVYQSQARSSGYSWIWKANLTRVNTSLQTQITQNATAISSKVSEGEFGTLIAQNKDSVQIAWNNISKFISFENAALNIYDNGTTQNNSTLLMKLNSSGLNLYESDGNSGNRLTMLMNRDGANYYNEGNRVGKIGTNKMAGDATIRGLTFNLETVANGDTARYMSWAYRENSNDDFYSIKMAYYTNDFNYTDSNNNTSHWEQGFHFADDVYFSDDIHIGKNGYLGAYNQGIILENNNSGLLSLKGNGASITLNSNISIASSNAGHVSSMVDFYMNDHTIYDSAISSSSDARLKKNISNSCENALSTLEKIGVSQFDWIESGEHIAAGLIAQQLREIIPQAVLENPNTTRLSIRTDILIPYIIKAIQELIECMRTDDKYKNALQSIGVSTSRSKKEWSDKTSISDKIKFISKTKTEPLMAESFNRKDKKSKKIILPG